MNLSQKTLYHQIHPAKLLTDWVSAFISLYFLWQHQLVAGLTLQIVPSVVASLLVIRLANLDKYEYSTYGRYLAKYMTKQMQLLRLLGNVVTIFGAWFQNFWLIAAGIVIIAFGWTRGLIFP